MKIKKPIPVRNPRKELLELLAQVDATYQTSFKVMYGADTTRTLAKTLSLSMATIVAGIAETELEWAIEQTQKRLQLLVA